jgi:hypothetical protein
MEIDALIEAAKRFALLIGAELVEDLGGKGAIILRDMATNNISFNEAYTKLMSPEKAKATDDIDEITELVEDMADGNKDSDERERSVL